MRKAPPKVLVTFSLKTNKTILNSCSFSFLHSARQLTISRHTPSLEEPDILKVIVTKPWYPKTVRGKIRLADVVDQLMEVLENCDPDTYSEARQDVVNIYRCALSVGTRKIFCIL